MCCKSEVARVCQVRTLARDKDWEGLEAFAREKKPPIGLDPFIAAAKTHGAPDAVTARCADCCYTAFQPHTWALLSGR